MGGSVDFHVTVLNSLSAGIDETFSQAQIDADNANLTLANQIPVTLNAAPDLVLKKDDGGLIATTSQTIVYTLNYSNAGNQAATGVTLLEKVPGNTTFDAASSSPDWSCTNGALPNSTCSISIGSLDQGEQGSAIFAVKAPAQLPSNSLMIHNEAKLVDDGNNGVDLNGANNRASVHTTRRDTELGCLQTRFFGTGSESRWNSKCWRYHTLYNYDNE